MSESQKVLSLAETLSVVAALLAERPAPVARMVTETEAVTGELPGSDETGAVRRANTDTVGEYGE